MDMIDKFFEKKLINNNNTKRGYRRGITLFFEINKLDIDTYFKSKPDYEKHIASYWNYLEKNTTKTTRKNRINAIKLFLRTYDKKTRELDIWDTIRSRLRNTTSESEETALDKSDVKKILQYADIGSKAMFLILASSGCRIGELVQLLPDDIHTEETPTRIHFRAEITKTKTKRDSFITQEATEVYEAWMNIRDEYLENAVKKCSGNWGKKSEDNRVFPMSDINARSKWKTMVRKSGYDSRDPKTNRLKAHPHSLRKFFRSYLGNADLSEVLMGHMGYLSTYRKYNLKQLAKEYEKYANNVSIYESPDMSDVQEQITTLKKENAELKADMEKLMRHIYIEGMEKKKD